MNLMNEKVQKLEYENNLLLQQQFQNSQIFDQNAFPKY